MPEEKHEEEHANHERWLVSYADFITLLFAFFVVMYAVSRVDNKKLNQAANSIKWAMHFGGTGGVGQMPIFDQPASSHRSCSSDSIRSSGEGGNAASRASVVARYAYRPRCFR
jgi:flagellar motor protein MotB